MITPEIMFVHVVEIPSMPAAENPADETKVAFVNEKVAALIVPIHGVCNSTPFHSGLTGELVLAVITLVPTSNWSAFNAAAFVSE